MSGQAGLSESVGWHLIVFISVFTPLQLIIVAFRFYARSLTKAKYDFGDALILVALFCQLIQTGVGIGAEVQAGVGVHIEYLAEIDPEKITLFFKYLVFIAIWYVATIGLTKLAICKLYRTLFPGKFVYIILCITAFILIATPVATVIALLVACRPFSANWGSAEEQKTHCFNKEALFVWASLPNIITDLVLLSIPLPIVWRLHTTAKLKVALSVTFVIGGLGLVASILRFISFHNTNSFTDATYNASELIIWTLAEPGIYLISASLLMLRPLLDRWKTNRFETTASSRGMGGSSTVRSRAYPGDREPYEGSNSMNMTLVSRGQHGGFVPLDDSEGDPKSHSSGQGITVTTDIQQAWDKV
ncbi:hypothetical protein F5Y16DRAFT_396950 [Xylariaceae sp. FL0255]|nr:hypothetical protein F5Y16DRAFT_396950 [Xylariaceae sp. FL0255]